ncbi:MAG TPA: hypothetical protein VIL30_24780 [Ramlibacter sp.]
MLFALLAVLQISACGDTDRNRVYPVATGPSRIALTEDPVRMHFDAVGNYTTASVAVAMYGRDLNDVIGRGSFPMDKDGSVTIAGVKFDYASLGATAGDVTFVLNRAQYESIRSPLGARLGAVRADINATSSVAITTFGEGTFGLTQAYYYVFADSPEPVKFAYTANPERLAAMTKDWTISMTYGPTFTFLEKCATYLDNGASSRCTTDYADTSAYATSTSRTLLPGIYDVKVRARDNWGDEVSGAKLVVGLHPVARIKLAGPSTSTVGATLAFDAVDSVAGLTTGFLYTLEKPAGSKATLLDEWSRNPRLVADVPGTYTVTLTLSYNGEVSTARVSRLVTPVPTGASGG